MSAPVGPDAVTGVRGLLRERRFRRFWTMLAAASLGDWAGLLALTAFANAVAGDDYADRSLAIGGVLLLRLLPALVVGPLGGWVADRLDRRTTLVAGLALRAVLFASIPLVGTLWWLFVVTVLVEAVNAVWLPTKDATVPTLVSRQDLEDANRVNLATTYGAAVPAAALFVGLTSLAEALAVTTGWPEGAAGPSSLALGVVAVAFAVGAVAAVLLHDLPRRPVDADAGVLRAIVEGWSYAARTTVVRGLVVGVVGAFAAGGVVIGLGRVYVTDLGAGDPGYGLLFGSVFAGLGLGMWRGPRTLRQVSRRRLFGLSLVASGVLLLLLAAIGNMVVAVLLVLGLGTTAGVAWVTGYTLLGLEVEEALRGRTFALVQSLVRIALAAVLALAPLLAGLVGTHRIRVNDEAWLTYSGAQATFALAAVAAIVFGVVAFRQMDDRRGVSVLAEITGRAPSADYARRGLFVALEGGEGAGKSTQARLLSDWLTGAGHEVVLTREPGDTAVGGQIRQILLDPATGELVPRTEALLYAADKAEHVETVVRPALARGAVVVTDRYVDSTLAYQGAGRTIDRDELERVARWATGSLRPHLTVLLDVDPVTGLARFETPDRLEAEPVDFHRRVRASFLELAAADPDHYLVVDASLAPDDVAAAVRVRLEPLVARLGSPAEADA